MPTHLTVVSTSSRSRSADFWKFWSGQTISNLGSSLTYFVLPLLVYKLTGSALSLALDSIMGTLPLLLFGLVIGAWVDRVNRKKLMIGTDSIRALVLLVLPLLTTFHALTVWWVYGVSFVSSALAVGFDAAQFAAIPSLVNQDDLVTANGRIQASYSAARMSGPFLAGLLVTVMPLTSLLLLDAFSFLISAGSLMLIRKSFNAEEKPESTSLRHSIGEGLRYVIKHPVLRNLTALATLFNFVGITAVVQLVLFAKQHLHASNPQVGLLFSAGSVGFIVFSLAAGKIRKHIAFSKVIVCATALYGLLVLIFALLDWYWVDACIWLFCSGFVMLFNISTMSLYQVLVPNYMLGRITSTISVLAYIVSPLGMLIGGFAIEQTHQVAGVYGVIGIVMILIGLSFFFSPLGHAERYLPQERTPEE